MPDRRHLAPLEPAAVLLNAAYAAAIAGAFGFGLAFREIEAALAAVGAVLFVGLVYGLERLRLLDARRRQRRSVLVPDPGPRWPDDNATHARRLAPSQTGRHWRVTGQPWSTRVRLRLGAAIEALETLALMNHPPLQNRYLVLGAMASVAVVAAWSRSRSPGLAVLLVVGAGLVGAILVQSVRPKHASRSAPRSSPSKQPVARPIDTQNPP